MAEVEAERIHLARKADLLRLWQCARDLVARHAGLEQLDRLVHPLARLLVGGASRRGGASDVEGAVVGGAVAHQRLDDVAERVIARAAYAVGEGMRNRDAALA